MSKLDLTKDQIALDKTRKTLAMLIVWLGRELGKKGVEDLLAELGDLDE